MIAENAYTPDIAITAILDQRMKQWPPQTVATVKFLINEIISLADRDCLDLLRSRTVEQEVLNILDEA